MHKIVILIGLEEGVCSVPVCVCICVCVCVCVCIVAPPLLVTYHFKTYSDLSIPTFECAEEREHKVMVSVFDGYR